MLLEATLYHFYYVGEDEIKGIHVFCDPGVKGIVLMVHFVDLVGEGVCVEEAVEAVEKEVLEVVN